MRRLLTIALGLALLAGAAVLVVSRTSVRRSVEAFARAQLESILDELFTPTVAIGGFRYEWPLTAHLDDVSFDAAGEPIIEIARLEVRFASIPRRGEPVRIAGLRLVEPTVRVLVEDGGVRGFADFVASTGSRRDDGTSSVPSDFLRLEAIELVDGRFVWRHDAFGELVLEGIAIDARLDDAIDAAADDPRPETSDPAIDEIASRLERRIEPLESGPGVHPLDLDLRVAGIGRARALVDLDLDRGLVAMRLATLSGALDRSHADAMLASVATVVREHELRTAVRAAASGTIGFDGRLDDRLDFAVALDDAHATLAAYQFDAARLAVVGHATSDGARAAIEGTDVAGGTLDGDVRVDRVTRGDAVRAELSGAVDARDVDLATLREANLRGVLAGDLAFTVPLGSPRRTAGATGHVSIVDGRLARVPVIAAVVDAVGGLVGAAPAQDRFEAAVTLGRDGVRFDEFTLLAGPTAALGEGTVGWDRSLALALNAGPIEALAERAGPLADLLRAVATRLVHYRVDGTIDAPRIRVVPLGR